METGEYEETEVVPVASVSVGMVVRLCPTSDVVRRGRGLLLAAALEEGVRPVLRLDHAAAGRRIREDVPLATLIHGVRPAPLDG